MEQTPQTLDRESLRFFARMAASISHEIKNALAVINESAGLLEDFLTFGKESGTPPDPDRMLKAVRSVLKSVQRADHIVKNMNRFAHSHDHDVQAVELGELAGLMRDLMARDAGRQGVVVTVAENEAPVAVTSSAYRLAHLVGLLVDFAAAYCAPENRIVLETGSTRIGARLSVTGLVALDADAAGAFPPPEIKGVADSVGGQLQVSADQGRIDLHLPPDIGARV